MLVYWVAPQKHIASFMSPQPSAPPLPVWRDRTWDRLDQIRSLIFFTSSLSTAQEFSIAPSNSLLVQADDPALLKKKLTPYTFGALSEEASAEWVEKTRALDRSTPLVVFSKTYCQYSKKMKDLLQTLNVHPKPLIIEVDLRDDAAVIKAHLERLTGRATFPNLIIQGHSIGGWDDIDDLHRQGMFEVLLRSGGIDVRH
ncbi:thioredoxin-like protein [Clavulina sp. PMI_390]|nr:thioredoxin-like protein [Clavulina sp. PMI_390]